MVPSTGFFDRIAPFALCFAARRRATDESIPLLDADSSPISACVHRRLFAFLLRFVLQLHCAEGGG